jgi:hypothetical protein
MSITREEVTHLLKTNDRAVERALVVLYQRQTSDEQAVLQTRHTNGVGFNATDAKFGSDLAQKVLKGWRLTPGQIGSARRMLIKYGGQLVAAAEEKAARKSQAVA